jgi:hypothetical protein
MASRARSIASRSGGLDKNPMKRFRDVGDVRFEIEQLMADPNGLFVEPVAEGVLPELSFTRTPSTWGSSSPQPGANPDRFTGGADGNVFIVVGATTE